MDAPHTMNAKDVVWFSGRRDPALGPEMRAEAVTVGAVTPATIS
jgi:hypothetical protein